MSQQNQASKEEVQSTELNKMPAPGAAADTEFSAEEAAEVFQENPSAGTLSKTKDK